MEENQRRKNNWPLVALVVALGVGVIGGAFAYFTSTDTFENVFSTQPYKVAVTETFESPDNWTPGTTTDKTVVATNTGDVPVAVRVSYTEAWTDASNQTLPLKDGNNNAAAIINHPTNFTTNWEKSTEGGKDYYYYKTALQKNASTTTFLDSVTFNSAVAIGTEASCEFTLNDGTKIAADGEVPTGKHIVSKTCTTQTTGYGGGTYKLTITVETVQADQYRTAWNTNVAITNGQTANP